MFDDSRAFISRSFLRSVFDLEYRVYCAEGADAGFIDRLHEWDRRLQLSETQAESAFIQTFFVETWGYGEAGRVPSDQHTLIPKLQVPGAGAGGGAGEADLALGWFRGRKDATPQVLCEFKDIRSGLDAKQNRKGSTRSPVEQCLDYLRGARRRLLGNEAVLPWWGLVTDMNEFRLYSWDRAPQQFLRFAIRRPPDLFAGTYDLLSTSDEARFDRFLFRKLFQRDMLIAPLGRPSLLRLVERQWLREERRIEGAFYGHYKAVRERLFNVLRVGNAEFPGTPSDLLRLTQKLLDRFIFAFYCEDMGERMLFPPQFIRDFLKTRCTEPFYDPNGSELWAFFRRLFGVMNSGGRLGEMKVPFINGGLFEADPLLDGLAIPNHVFAAHGQGLNDASLDTDQSTLFHLSARYNYASRGDAKESLTLYTLGRIFEQSITELEYRTGELEGRETIARLSKRKRDGVYYTPEWVVTYLVEHALAPWFSAAKSACGYREDGTPPDRAAARAYIGKLRAIRVVDPACGSGAFLIAAFRRLLEERMAAQRDLAQLGSGAIPEVVRDAPLIADILANNIHGVDINPAAVEIAKLALWLHSARAQAPLSSLDHTIQCGNSLVGPDFWAGRQRAPDHAERINAFDWRAAFPEIWPGGGEGGFDIVVGNPPYVKLQNLMKVDRDVVAYLQAARGGDTYLSAQSGNFDLYLPFIEKGLRLLAPGGRMAYIAPSLWTVNDYGAGLRALLRRTRQLERWVDFKSFQVFKDVTTYTALQFFTREPQDAVKITTAPEGEIADIDWTDAALRVPYEALPPDAEWLMATGAERALIDRLARDCPRLDDPSLTQEIFVGIQTSADAIYHFDRLGPGLYRCAPKDRPAYEVRIEDELMKPLVSGPEAKRYEEPQTNTYLLFPYERSERGNMHLISVEELARRFPQAWAHLRSFEEPLRARENRAFNDQQWHRFGRNQNTDKQDMTKLVVAQTVPALRVCADTASDKYLNNVRVNGILAAQGTDQFYLLGVLNGAVADFVFRRIGKPKQGGWFEANRQFIAPLPVPDAAPEDRADVAARARRLQSGWTRRRELLRAAEERLSVLPRSRHPVKWLWPDLPDIADVVEDAPRSLKLRSQRDDWARQQLDEKVEARLSALQSVLDGGGRLDAGYRDGEMQLHARGIVALGRIYLDAAEGGLTKAYWRFLLLAQTWSDAQKLTAELRRAPAGADAPAARQFIERVVALADETDAIAAEERAMNERLYDLYRLSPDERALVEKDGAGRAVA